MSKKLFKCPYCGLFSSVSMPSGNWQKECRHATNRSIHGTDTVTEDTPVSMIFERVTTTTQTLAPYSTVEDDDD